MRHRVRGRGLGRSPSHRRAMIRNMVTSLLEFERIETTDQKAKEIKPIAEKIITLGKRGDLHARRRALKFVRKRDVVAKVFSDLAERFKERPGGYTRITKLGRRHGDGAQVSILELLPAPTKAGLGRRTRRLRRGGKKTAEAATPAEAAAQKQEAAPKKEAPAKKEAPPKKEAKKAKPPEKKKEEPKKAAPKKAKEAPAKAKPKKKEDEKAAKAKKGKEKPAEKKAPAKKKTEKAPAKKTKPAKKSK